MMRYQSTRRRQRRWWKGKSDDDGDLLSKGIDVVEGGAEEEDAEARGSCRQREDLGGVAVTWQRLVATAVGWHSGDEIKRRWM